MPQVIIGLDVGSHTVRAVRLLVGFRTIELDKFVSCPLTGGEGDDPWSAVKQLARGADQIFTALPGDQLSIRNVEFPKAAAKRLDQALPIQLDGEIPFDISEMVLGHRVAGRLGDKLEILAVVAPRSRLESHLAELGEAGLNPREVAPAPVVLAELARRAFADEAVAVVDIGHERTDIAIAENGEFQRARTCSFGGNDITGALAKAFGVPGETADEWKRTAQYLVRGELDGLAGDQLQAAEAVRSAVDRLVREIHQTLAAHALGEGTPAGRIVLCGGGSRLRGLTDYLADELGVPVELFAAPESIINVGDNDMVGGATALALALQGTVPRGDRINLRQGDLAFEGEARGGRGMLLYAVAAVIVIMLTWGFSAYSRHVSLERQRAAQFEELAQSTKQLFGQSLHEFSALRTLMTQATEKNSSPSPIPERDAFDVVEQISQRIPQKINHEIDSLDIRTGRVQLKGRVDQRRDADEIMEALGAWEECFTKVPVPRTTPAVRDKRLQYTMDIETRCP